MGSTITLLPAYGRDYKSKQAVIADFDANKDFILSQFGSPDDGRYINREQVEGHEVWFRYAKLTKVFKHKF